MSNERFGFGKNWNSFLSVLDEDRIQTSAESLQKMLKLESLKGLTFLDVGSGSGLHSLAARRLGAKVYSFDYDVDSVNCTKELKRRYFPNDPDWHVEQGSALDPDYIKSLGTFDIVYSWGVLHHTGDMWSALELVSSLVKDGGYLYISIYNYVSRRAKRWTKIKRLYNTSKLFRYASTVLYVGKQYFSNALYGLRKYKDPFYKFKEFKTKRGMSLYHDLVDWLGGYPYETASPEEIFSFYRDKGYILTELTTTTGLSTNSFVFKKQSL